MKTSLNKGRENNDNCLPLKGEKEENDFIDSNTDNEASTSDDPFFIMTLEFEKGKYKKIKIFPTSDPTELAFNFCKENNLDFSSLKFLTKEISILLAKYNSKQLDLFQSNNSIQEVEEEHIQTELTKSPEKNEEEKSHRSGHKFIYSSIDSTRNNNHNDTTNKQCQNNNNIVIDDQMQNISKALVENQLTVEECEGNEEEKERDNKCSNNDFINYKEEYYPTNEDNENIEYIKLNLKAPEATNDNNKQEERKEDEETKVLEIENEKRTERYQVNQGELDQEKTRALLFNSQTQCKSVQSSLKNEENKTSKPSNTLQSTDNINDNNASSRLSYTMKPHPKLTNFQTEEDELAKLIEIKRKKDEQIRQLQSELENEEREQERQREEQLFLEEQDRIEREEYIKYETEQALKRSAPHINGKETKKKKLTLNEIDYNFIEEKYIRSENKPPQKNNYKQLIIETTKSNHKPTIPAPNIDSNQHLFQYEILTDHQNTSQRLSLSSHLKNERSHQCVTSSNAQHNIKGDNGTNIISLKKNNFSLLKTEMNLNRCCSANIFEKLYSEAEAKRELPTRPCHFSYRKPSKHNAKISQTKSMSNSNSQNTHIKINSNDLILKNKYNKTTSKTPTASKRIQPHQRKADSYTNTNTTTTQINQNNSHSNSNINKSRARNRIIQKEHNQTTNSNLKSSSVMLSSQSKIMKTENNSNNNNRKDKESKINSLKLLTKRNLTNPLLKKKIEQIKKEFQEKCTFKPKINKQIMCDHGITEKQLKCEEKEMRSRQNTEMNKGNFASKDSHHHHHSKTKRKDCNAFNKNYDFPSKIKTNRNGIFNKSNDYSEPFKFINNPASMIAIKKEEAFLRLFRELDDDEDGVITSVHLSTKTVPDNIIALISPILNLVKHGITSFTAKTFLSSLNVIYEKMSSNNKQLLQDHFLQKRKKNPKQQSTNQYKAFIDNQIKKSSSHSSDKGISLSFSHNNLLIKKPKHYNSLIMTNASNELRFPNYDSDT